MADFVDQKFVDLTVRIDRNLCIGSGNCMKVAPETFDFDDKNIIAFKAGAAEIDRDRLIEACDVCPVDALIVLDPNGKQIAPL